MVWCTSVTTALLQHDGWQAPKNQPKAHSRKPRLHNTGMGRETLPQHKIEGEIQLQMLSSDLHAPSGASVCVYVYAHTHNVNHLKKMDTLYLAC